MQIFDSGKIYNFMKIRHLMFAVSGIFITVCIGLFFTKGFKFGIDFSGGTLIQIKYDTKAPLDEIRARLNSVELFKSASVSEFGNDKEITIRYAGTNSSMGSNPGALVADILKGTGNLEVRRVDVVGPKVGNELRVGAISALSVSLVLILIYIAFRFEFRFALAAIASEIHDIAIIIGVIIAFSVEINLEILAALLTIIGYSLNDTIVIFDRIRESITTSKHDNITQIINESISHTLSRTILTSFTTLISVVILYFFGGDMIHNFAFIMMIGVIVGTLSSIFIAAQLLIVLKFDVIKYREMLAKKELERKEREKIRAMYEKGTL